MRIARFNTGTILSSWTNLAVAGALRSMGHEVLEGVIPTNAHGAVIHQLGRQEYERAMGGMPTLDQLKTCDVILVSGPEYVAVWLNTLYGKEEWRKLSAKKVGFYLESSQREDVQFQYEIFADWYDVHFYPDPRDAQRLKGHHIIPYVDTEMFRPCDLEKDSGHDCSNGCRTRRMQAKKYDAAFVGSLYGKRMQFLTRLLPLIPEIDFHANGVTVRDLGGECQREWAQLMVKNLRQIKVHVALPSNNTNMIVMRPFETLACGTFLLTYKTNDNLLRDGEHCRMYDPEKPEELAEMIRYYVSHEDEREAIAKAGFEEIRRNYSIQKRMTEVLDIVSRS